MATCKVNEWIINGKIYNLRPYLDKHPGGKRILSLNAGRDCTELFFSYHFPSNKFKFIESKLKEFYVRDSNNGLTPFDWKGKNYEMYLDLKSRLISYFKLKNAHKSAHAYNRNYYKANTVYLCYYVLLLILLIIVHYYWFNGYYITIAPLGILHYFYSMDIMHQGTHYAIFKHPQLNQLLSATAGFYFSPTLLWEIQHVISHHTYTNIHTKDADLYHFDRFWRTCKTQQYRPLHRFWRWLMFPLTLFTSLGVTFQYFVAYNIEKQMTTNWPNYKTMMNSIFMMQLLWILIFLPLTTIYYIGLLKGVLFVILTRSVNGILFYVISQVSHIQTDAFDAQCKGNTQSSNWIIHQIQSSVDYSVESYVWSFLSIGLNNQAIHHLFPSIHPCYYTDLQPLFNQFCADYHIKRNVTPNLFQAFLSHIKYLAKLNDS